MRKEVLLLFLVLMVSCTAPIEEKIVVEEQGVIDEPETVVQPQAENVMPSVNDVPTKPVAETISFSW